MRADRLLAILLLLQSKGRMTAHELAEELEVSERTIYRDLEALSIAGIPVYTERGPGGGCELLDGYQTKLNGLSAAEVRALFLGTLASPLADLGLADAMEDALLKLNVALSPGLREQAEQARRRVYLDTSGHEHGNTVLPIIQQALWQDHCLHIVYCERDGMRRVQQIEPYGLVSKAACWYLIGANAGQHQIYPVMRIQQAEVLDVQFERVLDFDLEQYWATCSAEVLLSDEIVLARDDTSPRQAVRRQAVKFNGIHTVSRSPRKKTASPIQRPTKKTCIPIGVATKKTYLPLRVTAAVSRTAATKKTVSPGYRPIKKRNFTLLTGSNSSKKAISKKKNSAGKEKNVLLKKVHVFTGKQKKEFPSTFSPFPLVA
jgi:predicted DNA-binding transcriptional regulator YafY